MFINSKWIWANENSKANDRVNFYIKTNLKAVPNSAVFNIGCETKYWLFVNGNLVVFDGGLFRESLNGCGYYDFIDIAKYLKIGDNEIVIHAWYFGNGGRNNSYCSKAGVIFECEELSLFSNENTLCELDTAYYFTKTDNPSYLYGGHNTAYDARIKTFSLCPQFINMSNAVVLGNYGDAPWGNLVRRCVPLLFFSDRIKCEFTKIDNKFTVKLPYAMHFSPYIKVCANGGEVIDMRSDRFDVNGGPGDPNQYHGHRAEYVCKSGEQEFEMLDYVFGEEIYFTIPDSVKILELGYRESGYDCKVVGNFECDNVSINKLFNKCVRTLRVCMRENYMDCPDRERGQWIGDVSVQAPQVIYLLDENGKLLLRKAIYDFINLRKGDRLVGNVPGDNFSELPSQSLNAISEWGMISTYYAATKDIEILKLAFEPAIAYLKLWETDEDGVVVARAGDWEWYDHLYNDDKPILNICWYYSALKFAKFMATELGITTHDLFINERTAAIEKTFDNRYWKGGFYSSGSFVDDRANAMAVLSGLCSKDKYPTIRYILMSVFNSTTYMENYVLTALCEMGYKEDAFRRMSCRYQPLIENENSTLWEDFFHLGTKNHAWSGGAATILFKYFAGVSLDYSVKETTFAPLKNIKCEFVNAQGEKVLIQR